MHKSVLNWVQSLGVPSNGADVLEIGSFDVNGSVRPLFQKAKSYLGIDQQPGPGVDLVMNSHSLRLDSASFDIVISTEVLEHDSRFWLSLSEMGRVLKPGGHLILTARGNGFPFHAYPQDFYRFMPQFFQILMGLAGCHAINITEDPECAGLFGMGFRIAQDPTLINRSAGNG